MGSVEDTKEIEICRKFVRSCSNHYRKLLERKPNNTEHLEPRKKGDYTKDCEICGLWLKHCCTTVAAWQKSVSDKKSAESAKSLRKPRKKLAKLDSGESTDSGTPSPPSPVSTVSAPSTPSVSPSSAASSASSFSIPSSVNRLLRT